MEAKEATRAAPSRTSREDYKATSDPALQEAADRGQAQLLSYRELYMLWERQQWRTPGALVEAITLYHRVMEGMLALTGQHFIMEYNAQEGVLPAFVEGFQTVARDEHRHVAFGTAFLHEKAVEDETYKRAIQRTLEESLPIADKVLSPPWAQDDEDFEMFGYTLTETREFAATALTRRLKFIGLA